MLEHAGRHEEGGLVFAYYVQDPERYGVVEFDDRMNVVGIEEKPKRPRSNYAVTGLYFYDGSVVEIAKRLKPSDRGELEITDLNNEYLRRDKLRVQLLGRGIAYLDTGTHQSLLEASNFVQIVENRQGLKMRAWRKSRFEKATSARASSRTSRTIRQRTRIVSILKRLLASGT